MSDLYACMSIVLTASSQFQLSNGSLLIFITGENIYIYIWWVIYCNDLLPLRSIGTDFIIESSCRYISAISFIPYTEFA